MKKNLSVNVKIGRDARDGRFVNKKTVVKRPGSTIMQTVKRHITRRKV